MADKNTSEKSGFWKSLAAIAGGWVPKKEVDKKAFSSKDINVDFVKVKQPDDITKLFDTGNILKGKGSERLNVLFETWLKDISDINFQDRLKLIQEIDFMEQSDPFVNRATKLTADEATQLDSQDHIISVETPDVKLTEAVYALIRKWGLTQQKIRQTIYSIAKYGDAFWGHKLSETRGIEAIKLLSVKQIKSRLEFNPIEVINRLSEIQGYADLVNREARVKQLIDIVNNPTDPDNNIPSVFDTKLFGYVLSDDYVLPPWEVTHFRYNAEGSELYPYGRSDLIDCLVPFKLSQSTQTLQAIARTLSFPVSVFKVKTHESMDEVAQFEAVEKVRQEYENLGVTPTTGQSEVYTVNTKMWIPDGLVELEMVKSEVDIDFIGDLEHYDDRVAFSTGVPKGYLDQEFGGFGVSGVALTEQYKPFARKVYTIQAAFLQGLEDLIRLHFSITKTFDYKSPFILSMRFPAEEMGDDKMNARNASMELAAAVIDTIKLALGADENEELPPAVVKDILGKYTFLSPEDIAKWTNKSNLYWASAAGDLDDEGNPKGGDEGGDEFEVGGSFGGGSSGGFGSEDETDDTEITDVEDDETKEPNALPNDLASDIDLGESKNRSSRSIKEVHKQRIRELNERYTQTRSQLFIESLVRNDIFEYNNTSDKLHSKVCYYENNSNDHIYRVWGSQGPVNSLREETKLTITEALNEIKLDEQTARRDRLTDYFRNKKELNNQASSDKE